MNMNMKMNVHNTSTPQTIETPIVIQTGDVHVLKGEGMPKANKRSHHHHHMDDHQHHHHHHHDNEKERSEKYGDLYVQYVVEMPSTNPENLQKLSKEERQMLGILLDKIQNTPRKTTTLSKGQEEGETYSTKPEPYRLQKSRVADFGKASGIAMPERDEEDDHMHVNNGGGMEDGVGYQHQHPFGSTSSRGFHFASGGQFFSRGSSPFTSYGGAGGEDEGDVQCQQM
mmetsp:Transcript_6517/g.9751  ORF Transcript_6517/g.9751 Transcript_6517/m.9751 type:complete len:227 (+) Transcript_6517:3-683(+)